jgi:adenosylmethionine-8-amino-7-oxononanoate aminotransferase
MSTKKYKGVPYHLWNPYTEMGKFTTFLGMGPTVITRGEGLYFFNARGKRYINGNSCTWNFSLGYGREEIIEAATKQMGELPFSSCWGLVHPRAIELAAKLVQITSGNFKHVYLGSNGSEAVETALKLARQYHRQSPDPQDHSRFKIISLRGSYHGYPYGTISLTGLEIHDKKFGPLVPGFSQIEPPYCYRCPYQQGKFPAQDGYPDCGLLCAQALEKIIQDEGPETVAAFVMEPIMGEMGVIEPPEEYYRSVGEICRRYGLLFIVDEVTTGFGRAGKLFVSQDWNPQPDILCQGKAISGGYLPLAATLTTEAIYQRFLGEENFFMHGSTNSGHPVCAAVSLAAIDIILREKLVENSAKVGAYLKSRLVELMDHHPVIGDVRGRGLMLALELVQDRQTRAPFSKTGIFNFVMDSLDRGLMLSYNELGLILFPPLILDEGGADTIVWIINQSLRTGFSAELSRKARLLKEFVVSRW